MTLGPRSHYQSQSAAECALTSILRYSRAAFRSVFTPDLRPPLALLHSPHTVLWIHELGTDVNKLDRESTSASATCVRDFHPTVVQETRGYIIGLGRLLGPPMSFSVFACFSQSGGEDRFLMKWDDRQQVEEEA